jgi:hypothetical protein
LENLVHKKRKIEMKAPFVKAGAALAVLSLILSFNLLVAQSHVDNPGQTAMKDARVGQVPDDSPMQVNDEIIPRHAVLAPQLQAGTATRTVIEEGQVRLLAATPLTTWNGSFTFQGTTYNYNMVGTAPSTGTSTTVQAFIIPIKLVIGTHTFDPQTKLSNGNTTVQNTVASPVFATGVDFTSGGVDMGSTQYIDAYQRANFWGTVSSHTGYHLLLGGPTVQPEVSLTVPKRSGTTGTPFGSLAGEVDINYFDAQVRSIITNTAAIQPNTLPIFLIYDTYLTSNHSCCIGGYHSSTGSTSAPQAYAVFSYVDHPGQFAQDVSALSHEIGEWADDPLVVNTGGNNSPCGVLENGDPLENNPNFGGFPYTLNGFTYNLQDLVTLPYFGAPPSTSVNNEFTFQGQSLTVCQNGS